MADVLVDTDVLIDHLRGAARFDAADRAIYVSVVTRCELYAGRSTNAAVIETLLAPFRELDVDGRVATRAGKLRQRLPIRTPDALIAATALEHGLALLTRNRRDFEVVPDLEILDP